MDDSFPSAMPPSPPPQPPESPALRAIERDLRGQRYLVQAVMCVLIVVLITTTLTLFHQIRWLVNQANQLNATSQELAKVVGEYETNTLPQMNRLFAELRRYAIGDPDFAKIMARYRFVDDSQAAGSSVRSGTNAPGAGGAAPAATR